MVKPKGERIEKADVLAYIESQKATPTPTPPTRFAASPKARRLAAELDLDLASIKGSASDGVIQAADVLAADKTSGLPVVAVATLSELPVSTVWRIMVERITQCWMTVPHFYLLREINASGLVAWRDKAQKGSEIKIT